MFFFFFKAKDGIRDIGVTGVQTCALPICGRAPLLKGLPSLYYAPKQLIEAAFSRKVGCAKLGALLFLIALLLAPQRLGVLLDQGPVVLLGGFYDALPGSTQGTEGCH